MNRREFLSILGTGFYLFIDPSQYLISQLDTAGPWIELSQLPETVQSVISLTPNTFIDQAGYLSYTVDRFPFYSADIKQSERVRLVQTRWNKEHTNPIDELTGYVPWAIVLHWYGDHVLYDKTIKGYLRGFNNNRIIDGISTQTSAHFLVGDSPLYSLGADNEISIIQTQIPSPSGVPYLASSLSVDIPQADTNCRSKYLRSAEKLNYQNESFNPILIDMSYESIIDPNMRSIAIEITGMDFDDHDQLSDQKIANVVSTIWALMKRYHIPACDLVGHHEIQMDKRDPGDKFMATIRYLIGIKGLLTSDEVMRNLIFGPYLSTDRSLGAAATKYFESIFDYINLVTYPRKVFEWVSWSKYLGFMDLLRGNNQQPIHVEKFISPIRGVIDERSKEYKYINGYKGVEIIPGSSGNYTALLTGDGVCIDLGYTGYNTYSAAFRHRLKNGAEIVTVYINLSDLGSHLQLDGFYPTGTAIGSVKESFGKHLCLAVAYSAPWLIGIESLQCGVICIKDEYLDYYFLNPNEIIPL